MELSNTAQFARIASDNETMHVVVISQLAKHEEKSGFLRHHFAPMLFAFFYFWSSYILYFIQPKWSYELNYLFEAFAFEQYGIFLKTHEESLKSKRIKSDFLDWYGRKSKNQYEFFQSVQIDEIIHRNQSIEKINSLGV